jgi:hypothetical protein
LRGLIKTSGTSETCWRMRSAYQIRHRCYEWQNNSSTAPSSTHSECRLTLYFSVMLYLRNSLCWLKLRTQIVIRAAAVRIYDCGVKLIVRKYGQTLIYFKKNLFCSFNENFLCAKDSFPI